MPTNNNPMTNLAAAVERVHALSQHFKNDGWPCATVSVDDLETILAELGRGAGEPKHVFEIPVDRYDWTEDGMEIIPKNQSGPNEYVKYDDYEKLYNTRPPVAGLAELRKLGYVLRTGHGDIFREEKPECEIDKWVAVYVPNTEAAIEFLGKVDG